MRHIYIIYYILGKKAGRAPAVAIAGKVAAVVPTATAPTATARVTAPTTAVAAITANDLGNECFSKSHFQEAIQHYWSAITLDGTNHIYYCNRSYAYQQIKSWTCAIADARKVSITSLQNEELV